MYIDIRRGCSKKNHTLLLVKNDVPQPREVTAEGGMGLSGDDAAGNPKMLLPTAEDVVTGRKMLLPQADGA
jgi:hypothetical protein